MINKIRNYYNVEIEIHCYWKFFLIIFIEDSTESGYIVHKRETKPINPLLLDKVVEILLKYENDVWAILLSTGNEYEKTLTGCTIGELKGMARDNKLLNSLDYTPFESERKVHVSNKSRSEDKNTITLQLFDRGTRSWISPVLFWMLWKSLADCFLPFIENVKMALHLTTLRRIIEPQD